SAEIRRAKEELLGLHKPLWQQYTDWVKRMVMLDFGNSWSHNQPVVQLVLSHIGPTIQINIISVVLTYLISIPLGVGQAVKRGKLFDQATTVATFLLYAAPVYWIGPLLIIYFCSVEYFNWFPPGE